MNDKFESDRGIGALSAFALAASEENGRGHLVITAPTGRSAGVMPALVYGLLESNTFLVQLRILHRRDRAGSLTNLGTAPDQRPTGRNPEFSHPAALTSASHWGGLAVKN